MSSQILSVLLYLFYLCSDNHVRVWEGVTINSAYPSQKWAWLPQYSPESYLTGVYNPASSSSFIAGLLSGSVCVAWSNSGLFVCYLVFLWMPKPFGPALLCSGVHACLPALLLETPAWPTVAHIDIFTCIPPRKNISGKTIPPVKVTQTNLRKHLTLTYHTTVW